jgi:hypothetical protein
VDAANRTRTQAIPRMARDASTAVCATSVVALPGSSGNCLLFPEMLTDAGPFCSLRLLIVAAHPPLMTMGFDSVQPYSYAFVSDVDPSPPRAPPSPPRREPAELRVI